MNSVLLGNMNLMNVTMRIANYPNILDYILIILFISSTMVCWFIFQFVISFLKMNRKRK